ncbi:DNA-deoxyinosine glycosylase [Aurantiacibacter hainanensis]|uniref:DNA-deoxyinosine glycosylase n=1 Tax=Aurantiacibacter hainanensis TaxID=3076114 RepID=UPI0030C70995
MSQRKQSFAPVVSAETRVLILGSLPGERSLEAGQYYAHPRNLFWSLLEGVLDTELVRLSYQDRLEAILHHGIGLWDSVRSARRSGSLDSAMRDVEGADLPALVSGLPNLRAVAFNGKTSERVGKPQVAELPVDFLTLPSSSPAYAAMPLYEKQARWLVLKDYLARDFLETPSAQDH